MNPAKRKPALPAMHRGGSCGRLPETVPVSALRGGLDARRRPVLSRGERDCQRKQIPPNLYNLVLEDQGRRNDICWSVFSD